MKGILEFNLPEEQKEHSLALKALDYMLAIHDFCEWLRRQEDGSSEDLLLTLKEIKEEWNSILDDYEINPYN